MLDPASTLSTVVGKYTPALTRCDVRRLSRFSSVTPGLVAMAALMALKLHWLCLTGACLVSAAADGASPTCIDALHYTLALALMAAGICQT